MEKQEKAKTPVWLAVIWTVLGVLILASLAAMIYFGVRAIAGTGANNGPDDTREFTVPEILPREDVPSDAVYIDPEVSDITGLIDIRTSYSAEMICAALDGGELSYDVFRLTRNGSELKAVSPTKTIEFDGSILYVKTELYSYTVPATEKDFYLELGSASLDDVLAVSGENGAETELSMSEKIIMVSVFDAEHGINHYYEISLETGLVTYEMHYLNGVIYKLTRIQNIDVFANN